jgi:hypothetical protein
MRDKAAQANQKGDTGTERPGTTPESDVSQGQWSPEQPEQSQGKGHGPLKGTDTPATTDADSIDREKGKRTTM